jgi:Phosphotyrosine interaction domain (PTB/PID)
LSTGKFYYNQFNNINPLLLIPLTKIMMNVVFFRHEGRKMKQELRCHAVLCPRDDTARSMAASLTDRLHQALVDFRKEKLWRQNARLSLANCLQDNPSMPYRKLLLQAGTANYKPPIERSKSAPKLTAIEEAEFEEEEEDDMEDDDEELQDEDVAYAHAVTAEMNADTDRLSAAAAVEAANRQPAIVCQKPLFRTSFRGGGDDDEENSEADEEDDEDTEAGVQRRPSYLRVGGGGAVAAAASGELAEEEEEVDSAQQSQSVSPLSQGRSAGGSSSACSSASAHRRRRCRCRRHSDNNNEDDDCHSLSDQSDSGHGGEEEEERGIVAQALGKMKVSEQDAISDESGYSEEPIVPPPIPPEAPANTMTVLSVNHMAAVRTVGVSPPPPTEDSDSLRSNVDHRLEITLTADNCVVSHSSSENNNNNNNTITHNSGVVVTSKNMAESARLQAVRRTSSVFEGSRGVDAGDCLTPPRTPDLSPPLLPATLVMRRPSSTAKTSTTSPPPPLLPRPTDLTVRSVLLSEFSTSEKLRYIERSNLKTGGSGMGGGGGKPPASLLLNRQEFCINI